MTTRFSCRCFVAKPIVRPSELPSDVRTSPLPEGVALHSGCVRTGAQSGSPYLLRYCKFFFRIHVRICFVSIVQVSDHRYFWQIIGTLTSSACRSDGGCSAGIKMLLYGNKTWYKMYTGTDLRLAVKILLVYRLYGGV